MVVITISDCPPALRGDLTKWLFEINVGVYVGQISARVRDELWQRILENVKVGRVTMVYQTNNEQRLAFRVHNTYWKPIDFDGLTLMMRPLNQDIHSGRYLKPGYSKASRMQVIKRIKSAEAHKREEVEDLEEKRPEVSLPMALLSQSPSNSSLPILTSETPSFVPPNRDETITVNFTDQPHQNKIPEYTSHEHYSKRSIQSPPASDQSKHHNTTLKTSSQFDKQFSFGQSKIPHKLKEDLTTTSISHKTQNKHIPDCVIIDLETTGLNEIDDEIIEIGALKIKSEIIVDKFHCFISIDHSIPEFIIKLTGITDDMLSNSGIDLENALQQLTKFVESYPIVAHNISFDMSFLNHACNECNISTLKNRQLCTLELSRRLLPNIKSHKLKFLLDYFGIKGEAGHRSINDCMNVYLIYKRLFSILN